MIDVDPLQAVQRWRVEELGFLNALCLAIPHSPLRHQSTSVVTSPPILLYWTAWFRKFKPPPELFASSRSSSASACHSREWHLAKECGSCRVTHDRNYLSQADALIFSASDIRPELTLPSTRPSKESLWLLELLEPRVANYAREQSHLFNGVISYRLPADGADNMFYFSDYLPFLFPTEEARRRRRRETKKNAAIWIVSNCRAYERLALARELKRAGLSIDVFGRSCPGTLPLPSEKSVDELIENYRFYLSFENQVCDDYITEKLGRVLSLNVIAVVLGPPNLSHFLPDGWVDKVVNVADYDAVSDLAHFLQSNFDQKEEVVNITNRNDPSLNDYLRGVTNQRLGLCGLCQSIQSRRNEKHAAPSPPANPVNVSSFFEKIDQSCSWKNLSIIEDAIYLDSNRENFIEIQRQFWPFDNKYTL